jgi:hypothetical protein
MSLLFSCSTKEQLLIFFGGPRNKYWSILYSANDRMLLLLLLYSNLSFVTSYSHHQRLWLALVHLFSKAHIISPYSKSPATSQTLIFQALTLFRNICKHLPDYTASVLERCILHDILGSQTSLVSRRTAAFGVFIRPKKKCRDEPQR